MRLRITFALGVALAAVAPISTQSIPTGATDAWLKMLKLGTTVSVMHITAHPDDEQGGVLARLSFGDGARVTLLTLNRGESGDNAIGPQLFDALGLIRTEELLAADRYYGVDQQYFTTAVDYGFSKTLEESIAKWGRETVLGDVVRIIRMERPAIILSRFQGSERDGHGNHQAAGLMAQEAFRAAGDPSRYPDQIAEGLRPWQPRKLFIGGVRETEEWHVRVNTGEYSPVLGDSFDNLARRGLSFQRSQNGGRFSPSLGPVHSFFRQIGDSGDLHAASATFVDGLATTMEGAIGSAAGRSIDEAVAEALAAFTLGDPSASAPALARGLRLTREAMAASTDADQVHVLTIKAEQFQDASNAAVGATLVATTDPPLMGAPVPGQTFSVDTRFEVRGRMEVTPPAPAVVGDAGWRVTPADTAGTFRVTVAADAPISSKPYFFRNGLQESRYTLRDASQFGRPRPPAPLRAVARYFVDGVPVEIAVPVTRRESKAPYGEVTRVVRTVPRIAVRVTPAHAIVPTGGVERVAGGPEALPLRTTGARTIDVGVELLHNANEASNGQVMLRLPEGWAAKPASQAFGFARAGERASFRFTVTPKAAGSGAYEIEAVAIDGLGEYREGYELIDHRDLGLAYLYRDATTTVRGVNVATVAGLKVGYVMGIGDQVPEGLQQLGAEVTLLGEKELASANLSQFDTIMTGTRAYAVRDDLKTYNARLLDYARNGGNVIVLYNTQEFVPNTYAPFPAELPRNAEEVSEEDSPVAILSNTHQAFNWPNRITVADFDGWVEQRGSKFFTKWDRPYLTMISTHDKGQAPQEGGWLTARVGTGHWTYFAYALHRQLPYGVAGAYRITANLLALNQKPDGR